MTKLRIAFDGSPILGTRAGIYQYVKNISQHIEKSDSNLALHYFLGNKWDKELPELDEKSRNTNIYKYINNIFRLFGDRGEIFKKNINYYNQKKTFYNQINHIKPNLIHFTGTYIPVPDIPTISTFYDLSCFRYPDTHPKSRVLWQEKHLPTLLENSSHIITISEFSKSELISYFNIAPNRISVIYCGVDESFTAYRKESIIEILAKHNLRYKKYILSLGTIEPRKNIETTINAYIELPVKIKNEFPLVIVGSYGWKQQNLLKKYSDLVSKGHIIFLGYIEQHVLPKIISGTALLVYPSKYEGFGLPVLESMACGTPVITSNCSSMPEIVKNTDVLLDPEDTSSWTSLILKILSDPQYAEKLSLDGIKRSKTFNWHSAAEQIITIYSKLCDAV